MIIEYKTEKPLLIVMIRIKLSLFIWNRLLYNLMYHWVWCIFKILYITIPLKLTEMHLHVWSFQYI